LAASGHRVVLAARDRARLDAVAAEIADSVVVELDLSQPDNIKAAFQQAAAAVGRIDVLVNNAAITRDGLAVRMKRDDWDAVIQTNLTGAFLCMQQALPAMMRERWGRIINISSVVGETGNPGQANYVASKAGLIGLTKSLAQEIASRNITVNAIAPGFIETDMTAVLSPEVREAILGRIPLKRMGTPEDVAAAVAFLAGEGAGYITGHVLDVNGGLHM
jgi:3-oxoacyl-[acyl-carrier protein] reductase